MPDLDYYAPLAHADVLLLDGWIENRILNDYKHVNADVKKQYQNTVKPMHVKYIDPLKSVADVIISGELDIVDSTNRIIKEIDLLRN